MKNKLLKLLKNKWTIIIASVLLVAILGTVFALNFNNWFGTEDTSGELSSDIFWNVNRFDYAYQTGKASDLVRERDKTDGTYHILFCALSQQGRAVNRRAKNSTVVAKIDMNTAMGLKFDETGVVVDVVPLEEMGYKITAARVYVNGTPEKGKPVIINTSDRGDGVEKKIDIPASVPVYDVSGTTGEPGTRLTEGFIDGDCIYVVSDKKDNIKYVVVTERNVVGTIYYNKDRKYDARFQNTTREQSADGYYYIDLAYEGKVETFYTKDYTLVNYMDRTAGRAFGLELDENDPHLITDYFRTKEVTKGNIVASYYNVVSLDNGVLKVKYTGKRNSPKFGDEQTYTLAKNCRAMDVTGVEGVNYGEWTDVRPGDKVQCYLNGRGKICFIHVIASRTVGCELYWSLSRKWNTSTDTWTRKPEADGKYVFNVVAKSTPGVVKQVYTYNRQLAEEIDRKYAAPVFGLKLNGNEIVAHYTPLQTVGGTSIASYYKISSIDGKTLNFTSPKNGDKTWADMVEKPLIFNTQNLCKVDKVSVGDKVHSLLNSMGEVQIIYIIEKAPEVVKTAYCPHCNRTVSWYRFNGGKTTEDGRHYIMTENFEVRSDKAAFIVGGSNTVFNYKTTNTVLDLNGHSITSDYRILDIDDHNSLYVMDSKGGGVMRSTSQKYTDNGIAVRMGDASEFTLAGGTIDMSAVTEVGCQGMCVYVAPGSTFNMKGGTIKGCKSLYGTAYTISGKSATGGGMGGSVHVMGPATRTNDNGQSVKLTGAVFNMYDGVITGGRAEGTKNGDGGNISVLNGGTFNMYGGTVKDGYSSRHGGNINAFKGSNVNMYGGSVINGTAKGNGGNINVATDSLLDMSGGKITGGKSSAKGNNVYVDGKINLKGTSKITDGDLYMATSSTVTPSNLKDGAKFEVSRVRSGVFAKNIENAKSYEKYFSSYRDGLAVVGNNSEKTLSLVNSGHVHAKDGKTASKDDDKVYYEPLTQSDINDRFSGKLPTHGSYYLEEDLVVTGQASDTGDLNICYNGHNVAISSNGSSSARLLLLGNIEPEKMYAPGTSSTEINLCDCKDGGGMVKVDAESKAKGGMILINGTHKVTLNIYDGLYDASGISSVENGPFMVVNGPKSKEADDAAEVNIYGGQIIGGETTGKGGAIYVDSSLVSFNIKGGTIADGKALKGGNIGGYIKLSAKDCIIKDGIAKSADGSSEGLGGNIFVEGSGKLNLNNVTVTNGSATNGGNIYISGTNTTASIEDCYITNGSATEQNSTGGKGDNIYVNAITLNLKGDMTFDGVDTDKTDVYLASENANIKVADLGDDTKISVEFNYNGTVVIGGAEYFDKFKFISETQVEKSGDDIVTKVDTTHKHCVCGGDTNVGDHTSHEKVVYEPLTQEIITEKYSGKLPVKGNFYLEEDITLTGQTSVNSGSLNICYNGHTMSIESSGSSADRVLMLGRSSTTTKQTVNLCDCKGDGGMKKTDATSTATGAMIYVSAQRPTTVNIFGGVYDASGIKTDNNGGLIHVAAAKTPTLNIYGGKFIGAAESKASSGTIVNIASGALLNLYGGEFTCKEGTAENVYGINYPTEDELTISGKIVINGENGAVLRLGSKTTLKVGDLKEDSKICILPSSEGVFAKDAAKYKDLFTTTSDYKITVSGDDLKIEKK
ncbi:MAG: hypothetical protein IKF53_00645 [Clostridia bacterium]|nr:hypothetical protein [Clostridia bacterium]